LILQFVSLGMQAVQLDLQSLDLVGSGFDYRAQYRIASI
jgi:hypothetical protein